MQGPDLRWLAHATRGARAPGAPAPGAWRRLLSTPGFRVWPALVALLLLAGLLFVFQRVVTQGVVQGEQRRSAVAARADAQWRCSLLSVPNQRRQCLKRLAGA